MMRTKPTNEEILAALSRMDYYEQGEGLRAYDSCAMCGRLGPLYYYDVGGDCLCDCDYCVKDYVSSMYKDYATSGIYESWDEYLDEFAARGAKK